MDDPNRPDLSNGAVIATEDGAVRYYWRGLWKSLTWGTLGLFFTGTGIFMIAGLGMPLCFSVLFLPGLYLLYMAIGYIINYTEFRMEGGDLIVQHKPLPWQGNMSISTMEIDYIAVEGLTYQDVTSIEVVAFSKKGIPIGLVSDLKFDLADAIVREMARTLAIVVKGLNEMEEWYASQDWPATTGKIVDVQVVNDTTNDSEIYYALSITYQYAVADRMYTSQRVYVKNNPIYDNEKSAKRMAKQYKLNSSVTVYYNPDHPEKALLNRNLLRTPGS